VAKPAAWWCKVDQRSVPAFWGHNIPVSLISCATSRLHRPDRDGGMSASKKPTICAYPRFVRLIGSSPEEGSLPPGDDFIFAAFFWGAI